MPSLTQEENFQFQLTTHVVPVVYICILWVN